MTASRRAFLAALALGAPAGAGAQHGHGDERPAPAADGFAAEMHREMQVMAQAMASAAMTGDPDRDFLAMMIPHHQGAVAMARLVLLHGRDPLTRQLAEEIIAGQQAEISSMQARLAALAGGDAEAGRYPMLSGMRGR